MFADKLGFVARQMLLALVPDPLRWSVGYADTDSGKAGFEPAFRPGSPALSLPLGIGQRRGLIFLIANDAYDRRIAAMRDGLLCLRRACLHRFGRSA